MSKLGHVGFAIMLGLTLCAWSPTAMSATPSAMSATPSAMSATPSAADPAFRAELALRYGPIHHQDVHMHGAHALGGAADFITALDFDADFDGRNNWDDAGNRRFALSAHAYFSVAETASHWFITYQFFHPRDWSSTFFETEHENDSEGVLLAVARDGSRFGALRAAITVAHSNFYSYVPAGSRWSSGLEDVDGVLSLAPFAGQLHPVTAQEAETHALKAWPYFQIRSQGVVYYPSLTLAEVPSSPNDRDVRYLLHDMLEPGGLWARRDDPALFARYGVFAGNASAGCGTAVLWCVRDAARASWAWNDHNDHSPAGAMATDPAGLSRAYFTTRERVSTSYTYNPFRQNAFGSW